MMDAVAPFAYPIAPHVRRHVPAGYLDYRHFKPWLRDELEFRCVSHGPLIERPCTSSRVEITGRQRIIHGSRAPLAPLQLSTQTG
jgi:hypothetical protein